jgi:uncharacterized coiled-coil protein SlyX
MKISEAINAVRVMLGQDVATEKVEIFEDKDETTKTDKVSMASAELVDGTIVVTEGELAVGGTLFVEMPEGEENVLAPIGKHATKDNLIITVGEGGLIESIEEITSEAVEAGEEVEEKLEEEAKPEEMNAENLLGAIAELIAEYQSEITEVKEELSQLTERFSAVADMPAAKPVKKSFLEDATAAAKVADNRLNRLSSLRRQTLTK